MREMLANQYFMARKFLDAEIELEEVLSQSPMNKSARKKIIICYTHNNKITQALNFLHDLISEDISCIINTDPIADDCPCYELIHEVENKKLYNEHSSKYFTMLGIFWLYCNYDISLKNFESALDLDPENILIKKVVDLIYNYKQKEEVKQNFN